jgi:23S rRNA U2552 (ribose-2'-O)-methylase RlmE/FtsJ
MATTSAYVVDYEKSYPKNMPKIYRVISVDGVETARYEIIDFIEVISMAPEVGIEFTEKFKQYLLDIVSSIDVENGLSEFDHNQFLQLESAAIYISNNTSTIIDADLSEQGE